MCSLLWSQVLSLCCHSITSSTFQEALWLEEDWWNHVSSKEILWLATPLSPEQSNPSHAMHLAPIHSFIFHTLSFHFSMMMFVLNFLLFRLGLSLCLLMVSHSFCPFPSFFMQGFLVVGQPYLQSWFPLDLKETALDTNTCHFILYF